MSLIIPQIQHCLCTAWDFSSLCHADGQILFNLLIKSVQTGLVCILLAELKQICFEYKLYGYQLILLSSKDNVGDVALVLFLITGFD